MLNPSFMMLSGLMPSGHASPSTPLNDHHHGHNWGELTISPRLLSLDDALALARARRPFLKVQRQTILIEVEQIKVATAGYKPRLDARAGYEIRNKRTSDDLGDTVNGWFFGFTGDRKSVV